MAEAEIPVDLFNPGQVFACLGFVEVAEMLLGEAEGVFDWSGPGMLFRLSTGREEDPAARVLQFLAEAEVVALAPEGSMLSCEKWNIETEPVRRETGFPYPEPSSPATLPAALRDRCGNQINLTHWGDMARSDAVKFWAGSNGYPGAALARDALKLAQSQLRDGSEDPFSISAQQKSSFRFDWRRDYIPVDAGFSPNRHDHIVMVGFPVVELLAAIGLTHARPLRHDKLSYSYGVLGGGTPVAATLLRAALGSEPPLPGAQFRRFAIRLGWPGKEGQARCITDVYEETPA